RDFSRILSTYLRPHWTAVLLLLASSYVATALTGLLPVVMAPILDLALGSPTPTGGPVGWRGVSLGNLGATVLQWLGLGGDLDRLTAIAVLCGGFVAVGLLKGAFDFWNYRLALWIRVLADLVARLQEAILSVRVVKSFAAERFEAARLTSTLRNVLRVNVKYGAYKHAEEPARTAVGYIVEAGIVLLAARELLAGRLTVATFFLFLYVGR